MDSNHSVRNLSTRLFYILLSDSVILNIAKRIVNRNERTYWKDFVNLPVQHITFLVYFDRQNEGHFTHKWKFTFRYCYIRILGISMDVNIV